MALGSADLMPLEMAAAYATIANLGTHIEPYLLQKVSTPDGQVLDPSTSPPTYIATTPPVAYVLTHMMEGVIDHGTAYDYRTTCRSTSRARPAPRTTTPTPGSSASRRSYTILTWVGYDVKRSLGSGMSGAVAALPLWRAIAEDGLATGWLKKGDTFQVPPGVLVRDIEYYSGAALRARGAG